MEQPQGFVNPAFPHHVCKIHKALYGLKQAPRAWYTRLSQTLLEIGFSSSKVNPSLFLYHSNASHVFLRVYVDYIIVIGNHMATIQTIITKLQANFAIKDLGSLSYFLGIQISRDSTRLHLRQSKYIQDLPAPAWLIPSHTALHAPPDPKCPSLMAMLFPIPLITARLLELYNMLLSLVQTSPTPSTNSISTCTAPYPLTGQQLSEFFVTSKALLTLVFTTL